LMCAESEPLECHRFGMITPALKENGFDTRHILKDNTCISTAELESRLIEKFKKKLTTNDLYTTYEELLENAYLLLNKMIGFKVTDGSSQCDFPGGEPSI
jgi:hypothetical protein